MHWQEHTTQAAASLADVAGKHPGELYPLKVVSANEDGNHAALAKIKKRARKLNVMIATYAASLLLLSILLRVVSLTTLGVLRDTAHGRFQACCPSVIGNYRSPPSFCSKLLALSPV